MIGVIGLSCAPASLYTRAVAIDFSPYAAVLLDLDGTIYHEEHALPGAMDLIRRLQRDHKPFACLTNSTSSPALMAERLRRMGAHVNVEHIYTAGAAAADYVLKNWADRPRVYSLATEGVHHLLDGKVVWVNDPGERCDVILAGTLTSVFATEERLRTALTLLRGGAVQLVGICADRVYPSPRGIEFGSGALTALLSYAANVRPVFTGKPEPIFFQTLCEKMGVSPAACVLIGDNLESDIAGGRGVGMRTILTLTGVARREETLALSPDKQPHQIVEDLREV